MGWNHGENNPEFDSVSTDSLTDKSDGQAWETLRQIGYEKGDFIYMGPTFVSSNRSSNSTDSYAAYDNTDTDVYIPWGNLFPSNVQGQVFATIEVSDTGDAMDFRIRNLTDNENAVEVTGLTGSGSPVTVGPTNYTPTTTSTPVRLRPEFKNQDNATSVTIDKAIFGYGVTL